MVAWLGNRIAADRGVKRDGEGKAHGEADPDEGERSSPPPARLGERAEAEERSGEQPSTEVVDAKGAIVPPSGGTPCKRSRCDRERGEGRGPERPFRRGPLAMAADEETCEAKRDERRGERGDNVHGGSVGDSGRGTWRRGHAVHRDLPARGAWAIPPQATVRRLRRMRVPLRDRLGPLAERDFRLLFSATTITSLGDSLGHIALAFAVLELPGGGPRDLGIVLGVRIAVESLVVVGGGVLSDRLPRSVILVGASLTQAVAQAAIAALVLTGEATTGLLVAFSVLYGIGGGMVIPAEVGLVPQTVPAEQLQQANALQGLSRNVVSLLGPAVGGALIVAGSPGTALAVDAATFLLCTLLLARIRVGVRPADLARERFLHELREGWSEFRRHDWLWSSVLLFGVSNLAFVGCWSVLGPVVAKEQLGGASAWATVLVAAGAGSIVGGLVALHYRPRRPLLACCLVAWPIMLEVLGLALGVPVWLLVCCAFAAGMGIAIHLALWFTVFQREVPEHAQSRVSSYDVLGSFVLIPVGMAIAGPLSETIGVTETFWAGLAVMLAMQIAIVCVPGVRHLRAPYSEPDTVGVR